MKRCSPTRSSTCALSSSSPPPMPAPSSRPIRSARWWRSRKRWCKADQAAIDNARGDARLHQDHRAATPGAPACARSTRATSSTPRTPPGLVIITQLQPIAVQFSLPQQQIVRVNAAAAKGALAVDVFGNDGVTVVDTGKLTGIDNQVDPTTGTLKLKAEFPMPGIQLWPGQFVNVRLKVETPAAGDRGADLGGAARSGRDVQLCDRRRQRRRPPSRSW